MPRAPDGVVGREEGEGRGGGQEDVGEEEEEVRGPGGGLEAGRPGLGGESAGAAGGAERVRGEAGLADLRHREPGQEERGNTPQLSRTGLILSFRSLSWRNTRGNLRRENGPPGPPQ